MMYLCGRSSRSVANVCGINEEGGCNILKGGKVWSQRSLTHPHSEFRLYWVVFNIGINPETWQQCFHLFLNLLTKQHALRPTPNKWYLVTQTTAFIPKH